MEITPDGTPEELQDITIETPETAPFVPEAVLPIATPQISQETPIAEARPDLLADPEAKLPESPVAQNALIEKLKEDTQIQARLDALAGTEEATPHDYSECKVGDLVTFQAPESDSYDWRKEGGNQTQRTETAIQDRQRFSVSFHERGDYAYSVLLSGKSRKFFHVTVK